MLLPLLQTSLPSILTLFLIYKPSLASFPRHSPEKLTRSSSYRMGYDSLLAYCSMGGEIEEDILLDKDHSCFAALLLYHSSHREGILCPKMQIEGAHAD